MYMKKGLLVFTVAMLSQLVTVAQIAPLLRLTNSEGKAFLSWSGDTVPVYSLQTTASLLHPIIWSPLSWAFGSGVTNIQATNAQQYFRFASATPVFQFEIFYNINLEIDPGNAMYIVGPVFCNQSIWEGSSAIFDTNVTAVGTNCVVATDPFANNRTGTGNPTFLSPGQPKSYAPPLSFAGLGTNISSAAMQSILDLPPPDYAMGTVAAYSAKGLVYLANAADLVISNAPLGTNFGSLKPSGTNLTIYYQDSATSSYLNPLTPDYYIFKQPYINGGTATYSTNYVSLFTSDTNRCYTNVQYAGFSFVTNTAFYDYRESKTVQAVEIDVSKFNTWLTNTATNGGSYFNNLCLFDKGTTHPIDGIYVYNSVPETVTTLPAVRIVNGQVLASPAGLTVATAFPMYVKGNYNVRTNATTGGSDVDVNATTYTYPAALMADSITVLSANWSDSYNSSVPLGLRNPVVTTINAGMIEGIVPSNTNIFGNYSGGVENFMRLEENWASGSPLWYNGAIVVLFYSQYATNSWQAPGNYYQVPTRDWDFDSNFTNINKMPPLTPLVVNLLTP